MSCISLYDLFHVFVPRRLSLIANGCPWSTETCAEAASRGDFALLLWLHENFCPWDETTCANAAEKGHREIIQWARLYDCPSRVYPIDSEPNLGIIVGHRG